MTQLNIIETQGWEAELSLEYSARQGKSFVSGRRHVGPLVVQKAFYPEGDAVCHSIIVHPPGGLTGHDRLNLSVVVKPGARALLTTPAAGKFYRTKGGWARQTTHIHVGPGASAEWFPMENIVYPRCMAQVGTDVDLDDGAMFMGWEILCLGLPESKLPFDQGQVFQRLNIRREGRPLLMENGLLDGTEDLCAPYKTGGHPVLGTFVTTTDDPALVTLIRNEAQPPLIGDQFAVTTVDDLIICRFLGRDAFSAMACFIRAWEIIRPALLGRAACTPRIWRT